MKIVLNKCYGGFGLSHVAKMEILKLKGIEVFPYIYVSSDGNKETYRKPSAEDIEKKEKSILISSRIAYFQVNPEKDEIVIDYTSDNWNDYKDDFDFDYLSRADKDLVKVVEQLGKTASGGFAALEVVEIPDGASYEISDYDGIETAYYGFNIGSV